MKKGSTALRLFLYASLVSLVWLGAYVSLSELFAVKDSTKKEPGVSVTPAVELPMPAAKQWSVLVVKEEDGDVSEFLFRYADFLSDVLVFVDVPVETKAELAAGGYEVLRVYNPELPELFMISDLCRIFSEETWCMAAEEVGVALLGVRPKECYVIEKAMYERITEPVDGGVRFKTPASVKETVTEILEQAVTNDTLQEELLYWESYLDMDEIYYRVLPGETFPEEYQPDRAAIAAMTEGFTAGEFEEESE